MKHNYEVEKIPLKRIKHFYNSRAEYDENAMTTLMSSIKSHGLQTPISVRPDESGKNYNIIYGNRRFQAFKKLGLTEIPAFVHDDISDYDLKMQNAIENFHRADLDPVSKCEFFTELMEEYDLSARQIALRLGITANMVKATLALGETERSFIRESGTNIGYAEPGQKMKHGVVPITRANKIFRAKRNFKLTHAQAEEMFKAAAKFPEKWNDDIVDQYATNLITGNKKWFTDITDIRRIRTNLVLEGEHYDELVEKYVDSGRFSGMSDLIAARLRGEVRVVIDAYSNTQDGLESLT